MYLKSGIVRTNVSVLLKKKVISQMNGRLVTYLSLRWIAMGFLSEGTEPVPAERGYLVLTLKSSYLISKVASI